jgi:predicted DNA-binding transcriptional regulator YafY
MIEEATDQTAARKPGRLLFMPSRHPAPPEWVESQRGREVYRMICNEFRHPVSELWAGMIASCALGVEVLDAMSATNASLQEILSQAGSVRQRIRELPIGGESSHRLMKQIERTAAAA